MAPCTHPGMKRLFCLKAKNGLGRFAPSALPHYEEAFLPCTAAHNNKIPPKHLPTPHEAPNNAAPSPKTISQLLSLLNIHNVLHSSKKDLSKTPKKNIFFSLQTSNYPYRVQRGRRRRGCVGFAIAKRGKANGECGRRWRVDNNQIS